MSHPATCQSLSQLLCDADLLNYLDDFKFKLKVSAIEHLKYVTESDLTEIGMTKPEQRRLLEFKRKLFPASMFGKLKKKVKEVVGSSNESNLHDRLSNSESCVYTSEQHIIPSGRIVLCQQLGGGEFGEVWQGVWKINSSEKIQVAVKCISAAKMTSNTLNFVQEAAIMHKIRHANIVKFFGVVLEPKNIMLVTELAPLRSLSECLNKTPQAKINFNVLRLCDFAEQICAGMSYLETNRLIHRDLACRNILVFALDKIKISDFGLSRALGAGEEYYRGDLSVSVRLPIAWCAPECIKFLKFTSASDVWSFGVSLWEMFTYGFQPWLGMNGRQVLDAIDSPKFQRLEMPDDCPSDYYNLMLRSWQHESSARPKFADLFTLLPEIRPELVRTVACCTDGQPDHLQYDADDLLVVLNKRPKEYPDGYYWKGVVIEKQLRSKKGSGRTGLFSPANTIAHLPATGNFENRSYICDQISPKIDREAKNEIYKPDKKSIKINRHAIGRPEGDLRHTGHVGIDGSCFGNVGFVPEKNNLPLQIVAPFQKSFSNDELSFSVANAASPSSSSSSKNCGLAHFPSLMTSSDYVVDKIEEEFLLNSYSKNGTSIETSTNGGGRLPSTTSETASLLPSSPKIAGDSGARNLAFSTLTKKDKNLDKQVDNSSLLDEVFDALQIKGYRTETENYEKSLHPKSKETINSNCAEKTPLQLLTASDLQMLDDLSDLAAKMSEAALTNERRRLTKMAAVDEETSSDYSSRCSSVVNKLASKNAADLTTMTGSFSDNLPKEKRVEESLGSDALNAYKSLVDEGLASAVNPLQLLRNNGATVVRSFQRNSSSASPGKCPDSVAPPPIPPKFATTTTAKNSKKPPPVPPKPTSTSTNSPILPPKPTMINYTSIVDHQATHLVSNNYGKNALEEKMAEKETYFPQFTAETVDKYELLNFVLAPLSSQGE